MPYCIMDPSQFTIAGGEASEEQSKNVDHPHTGIHLDGSAHSSRYHQKLALLKYHVII